MFQFPAFAYRLAVYQLALMGCPIRKSAGHRIFAPYRSFSQLITSFFASESLGIHRLPLLTFCITDTGSFFIAKIENRVGLIYLQLALFFSLLYFFEVVQYVKDLFITPTGVYRGE